MAARQRVTGRRRADPLPILHLALGMAIVVLVLLLRPEEGDPLALYSIADRLAQGLVPYRDFPIEYPPLALLHLFLPRLLGGTSPFGYELYFTLISTALAIGTGWTVYWLARHGWSLHSPRNTILIFASLAFAAAPIVVWRFDILPTLLTSLALVAFAAQRNFSTGALIGFGTAAKLYPAFIGPVFFGVRLFERRFKSAAWMAVGAAGTVGAIATYLYLSAGLDAFSYILYQEERGVEIESVAGGLALLADATGVVGARIYLGFGSWQVSSQVLGALGTPLRIFDLFVVGSLLATAVWRFRADVRRTGSVAPATVVAYLVATLLAVILTNKVLSPQYLVWLLPFAALMPGRQSLLLMGILALTTLIYPLSFQNLVRIDPPVVIALNVRNLLLLVMFVWVIWPPGRSERGDVREAANQPGADPENKQAPRHATPARRDEDHQQARQPDR